MELPFPYKGKHQLWQLLCAALIFLFFTTAVVVSECRQAWGFAQACVLIIFAFTAYLIWIWWEDSRESVRLTSEAAAYDQAIRRLLKFVALGFAGLMVTETRQEHWVYGVVAQGVGFATLIAGAFFISGALLGFIFGFRPTTQNSGSGPQARKPHSFTNLEEVADWLTKLLLGAGLVELTRMEAPLKRLVNFVASGVNPSPGSPESISGLSSHSIPFIQVISSMSPGVATHPTQVGNAAIAFSSMSFFFTSGLLYGYLWNRYEVSLTSAAIPDPGSSAVTLADRWLNQTHISDEHSRVALISAIKEAPLPTQMQISLRTEQYRKGSSPERNTRSLPIFQGLIEADLYEVFHRCRGQYGLALIGQTAPSKRDWTLALDLLNKAIWIRDAYGEKGWPEYEFARAVCQIRLDHHFEQGNASAPDEIHSIAADLKRVVEVPADTQKIIDKGDVIKAWIEKNPLG